MYSVLRKMTVKKLKFTTNTVWPIKTKEVMCNDKNKFPIS